MPLLPPPPYPELASMLGYKVPELKRLDLAALLPQPYGLLHNKWLKDADTMLPKNSPASCR